MKAKHYFNTILFLSFIFGIFLFSNLMPRPEHSESERRKLTAFPPLSASSVLSGQFMKNFENFATDTIAFRESMRKVKANSALSLFQRKDNHGIYLSDGYAAKAEYPLRPKAIQHVVSRLKYLREKYLKDHTHIYLSVIPDKNAFLAKETGHLSIDYEKLEENLAKQLDFAQYIKISNLLEKEDFYKTDTHWRQEKILDVAEHLAKSMNTSLEWEWTEKTADENFLGVYAGQSGLPMPAESLKYLDCAELSECRVYDLQNNRPIPTYDLDLAKGRDGYEMFLSGALSLIKIENPKAYTTKKLILFRDSFGSSLAPLLFSAYQEITLVDIRYLHPNTLENYIDFRESDILFLYSGIVLNNGEIFK